MADAQPTPPDKNALLDEAYKRGILPPDYKAMYEEARRRGLVPEKLGGQGAIEPRQRNALDLIQADPAKTGGEFITQGEYNLKLREQRLKEIIDQQLGHDPDVDYDTGLSFGDRVSLDMADNPAERRMYLEQRYGKDAVGADAKGRTWVKIGDKKIASETTSIGAQLAASSPELAAGGAGAAIGAAGGPVGSIIGFGLGAMAGKGMVEADKATSGRYKKTPKEEAETLGKTAAFGAAGEGVGRGAIALLGRATKGPIPRKLSGVTPETEAMTAITTYGGASPPIRSAMPSSKIMQFHQNVSNKTVGPFRQEANQQFVDDQLKRILKRSGVPDDQLEKVFAELTNPKANISTAELGKDIQASVRARIAVNETAANDTMKQAQAQLDAQMKHLDTITRRFKPGDLGVDVAGGIQESRKDFSTAANKIYDRVDQIVGNQPIVPTGQLKKQAQKIIGALPKSDNRTVFHEIMDLPERIKVGDAQRLRTRMWEQADSMTLAPGTIKGDFSRLAKATDVAINNMDAQSGLQIMGERAKNLLRSADKWYADGIKKFEDATVNRLVKMAETGMAPDPGVIASTIIKPGYTEKAAQILKLLPPDVRNRVIAADFDNVMREATRTFEGKDMVQGKILANIIEQRGKLLDIVYGGRIAGEIRDFAFKLQARDGELPLESLNPSTFRSLMQNYKTLTETGESFLKDNYLSVLGKSKKMPEDVLKWIVRPGQEERLNIALKTFGEGSPQMASIRQMALRDLLRRAIVNTETGVKRGVSGSGLENALKEMTERQQQILFPNGLDEDLRLVADEAKFLFPADADKDMAGGLKAGILKGGMPWTLPIVAYSAGWGWLLSRPAVIRFLAIGLQGDGAARAATRETMRTLIQAAALDMVPDTGDER